MAEAGKNMLAQEDERFMSTNSAIINEIVSLCVLMLMVIFPLIYDDAYTNIMDVKYVSYYLPVIMMLGYSLIAVVVMAVMDMIKYQGRHTKKVLSGLLPKNWKKTFLVSDAAVLVFCVSFWISTFHSEYFFESFWGNEGRYSGMFLMTLYVAAYLMISRFWELREWYLEVFLVTGVIMCIIGITDYFRMDILNFRGPYTDPLESDIFTSTVGNINSFTAYVGMVMGFSGAMFITEDKGWRMVWHYICVVISFFAIIMGCSDNAYLSMGALFGLIPFVTFKDRECVKRYLIMLASFFTVLFCIDRINQLYGDAVIGLDSLFNVIAGLGVLPFVVLFLWALAFGFWKYDQTCSRKGRHTGNVFLYIWGVIAALVLLAVGAVLWDANLGGHQERYEAAKNYLVFSRHWGTNRGYIWGASLKLFSEFSWMGKLFGYGPDTFGILTMTEIPYEMTHVTGQLYDSAHNEYIQYLVTIGLVGLCSYLVFLGSVFWYMWRNWKENPYLIGLFAAVLCYAFQAAININLPIVAPMMWLLLSIGMGVCRKNRSRSLTAKDDEKQKLTFQ